jgi:tRNA uridine 5-carbamoylmethylation protein Kti12
MTQAPLFCVLVGLPGSGKTTLRNKIREDWNCEHILVTASTDDYIEVKAKMTGKTYSDVFSETIDEATRFNNETLQKAIAKRDCIIVDQTNLTSKKRRALLASLPKEYTKVAIVVECSEVARQDRLFCRPGKIIPSHIDALMRENFSHPSLDEGFDVVGDGVYWRKALAPYLFG